MSEILQGVLSRVRTFSISLWRYQSCKILDPYVLASLGYSVKAFMTLQCDACHHKVVVSENQDSAIQKKLSEHDQCCGMKRQILNFTDKLLYSEMASIVQTINSLSMNDLGEFPLINSKNLSSFIGSNVFLFKRVLSLYEINHRYFKTAFILQIFGWYIKINQEKQSCIFCHFCGRTINLKQYAKTNGVTQDIELQERTPDQKLFDPIEEHRYFCMWVMKDGGWIVMLQYLEDKFHETNFFKSKSTTGQIGRKNIQIKMFVDSLQTKLQKTLSKLMYVTNQAGNLCDTIGKDPQLSIQLYQSESDVKNLRNSQRQLQLLRDNIHNYYIERSLSKDQIN